MSMARSARRVRRTTVQIGIATPADVAVAKRTAILSCTFFSLTYRNMTENERERQKLYFYLLHYSSNLFYLYLLYSFHFMGVFGNMLFVKFRVQTAEVCQESFGQDWNLIFVQYYIVDVLDQF